VSRPVASTLPKTGNIDEASWMVRPIDIQRTPSGRRPSMWIRRYLRAALGSGDNGDYAVEGLQHMWIDFRPAFSDDDRRPAGGYSLQHHKRRATSEGLLVRPSAEHHGEQAVWPLRRALQEACNGG
jgi:hypothetical protein